MRTADRQPLIVICAGITPVPIRNASPTPTKIASGVTRRGTHGCRIPSGKNIVAVPRKRRHSRRCGASEKRVAMIATVSNASQEMPSTPPAPATEGPDRGAAI